LRESDQDDLFTFIGILYHVKISDKPFGIQTIHETEPFSAWVTYHLTIMVQKQQQTFMLEIEFIAEGLFLFRDRFGKIYLDRIKSSMIFFEMSGSE